MSPRLLVTIFAAATISLVTCGRDNSWADGGRVDSATIVGEIEPPGGFVRIPTDSGSFTSWLRAIPLRPPGTPLRTYDGRSYPYQQIHYRILDIDVGDRNLQQCADAAIRLRAEYLYSRGWLDSIAFKFTNGDRAEYLRWAEGYRPVIEGNRSRWQAGASPDSSYESFRDYLDIVFAYAGTYSLERDMLQLAPEDDVRPGDVFVRGGFPGHAIIVLDVAIGDRGRLALLLAQSFMPAQDIHILKNYWYRKTSPWFVMDKGGAFRSRYGTFDWSHLRRFGP